MLQPIDLRELSRLRGPERAFLSYYGSGGPDGLMESRERALRALLADDPDEAEHFQQNLDLLRATPGPRPPMGPGRPAPSSASPRTSCGLTRSRCRSPT